MILYEPVLLFYDMIDNSYVRNCVLALADHQCPVATAMPPGDDKSATW